MKPILLIFILLLITVAGVTVFKDMLSTTVNHIRFNCDVEATAQSFVKAYNAGKISTSTDYISKDFEWFSDTEFVNGQQFKHYVSHTHEELPAHFEDQFRLGQTIHITNLQVNGIGWHGGADMTFQGTSKTSDGVGVLSGKGVVDCRTKLISVWSMATHYPEIVPENE